MVGTDLTTPQVCALDMRKNVDAGDELFPHQFVGETLCLSFRNRDKNDFQMWSLFLFCLPIEFLLYPHVKVEYRRLRCSHVIFCEGGYLGFSWSAVDFGCLTGGVFWLLGTSIDRRYHDRVHPGAFDPYTLEQGSLDVLVPSVWHGGFLNSFERVTDSPHRAAVPTLVSASMCFEEAAWQHELSYLRAIRDGKAELAMDARIRQQIAHQKVAQT